MMIEMLKAELRKVWAYYVPFIIVLVGYVLLRGRPLENTDSIVAMMGVGQGWILGWRIFSDPNNTRPFLFSRPLSRRRLFLTRWTLGISLQALTIVVLFLVIASGLRSLLQVKMASPYHPMVWLFELQILWPVGLFSLLAYEVQIFLKLRAEILATRPNGWLNTLSQRIAIALTVLLLLLFFVPFAMQPVLEAPLIGRAITLFLLAYVVAITILATVASAHCYRHLEVEP